MENDQSQNGREVDRRSFLGSVALGAGGTRWLGALGLGSAAGWLAAGRGQAAGHVWQIDPDKCMACGNCQTHCVLDPSAVKAVQCFELCGFCDVCTGYFPTTDFELNSDAKNQLCPTDAVVRRYIESQATVRYYEYTIEEDKCIACGKCIEGCALMNGSLYLQVRHDLCRNCNECAIAVACPTGALRRMAPDEPGFPNLLKKKAQEALHMETGADDE